MDQWTDRSIDWWIQSGGFRDCYVTSDRVMENGRIDSVVDWCTDRLIDW